MTTTGPPKLNIKPLDGTLAGSPPPKPAPRPTGNYPKSKPVIRQLTEAALQEIKVGLFNKGYEAGHTAGLALGNEFLQASLTLTRKYNAALEAKLARISAAIDKLTAER